MLMHLAAARRHMLAYVLFMYSTENSSHVETRDSLYIDTLQPINRCMRCNGTAPTCIGTEIALYVLT